MRSGGAIEHQHMGQATANSTKKKFGKNFSKLAKPPAPPIASEAKTSASSRNGLLLLSTKRTGNAAQGLLASKQPAVAAPPMSLGLQYESTASTHDVLLGAVVGASRMSNESSHLQQPDAWGVAAAATSPTAATSELPSSTNGNNTQLNDTADSVISANVASTASPTPSDGVILPPSSTTTATAAPVANWDEYGGRSRSTYGSDNSNSYDGQRSSEYQDDEDNQQAYMIRLAQERAERRRAEEEARANEQQEKAAQRLKELENRIAERSPKAVMSNPGRLNNPSTTNELSVLEKLGSNVAVSETNPKAADPALTKGSTQQRTLYDPHRPYSVLVGGMPPPSGGPKTSESHGPDPAQQQPQQHHQQDQNGCRPRTKSGELAPGTYTGPVIHLTSYEDRDRGEASRSAGPRMLFDPKSGSMVAVREESGGSGGGGGGRGSRKNERRGKGFNIGGRGGGGNGDRTKGDENNGGNNNTNSSSTNKKIKQRSKNEKNSKDSASRQQQSKKTSSSSSTGKNLERKWPRTCGVLYARDEKGVTFCTDGCDGDLGYGAHSVPGGRLRNPDAYAKFSEQQQQQHHSMGEKDNANLNVDNSNGGSAKPQQKSANNIFQPPTTERRTGPGFITGTTALQTGFVPENPEAPIAQQPLPWVKPNEKITLLLDNNSSQLQATAQEWAPSEAALAAAAKVAEEDGVVIPSVGSTDNLDHQGDEDDDDSNCGVPLIGLGFDPKQISTVMQSPKLDPLEGVGFGALTLGAAFDSGKKNHNNIFAFGTSDTWGHTSPSNPDNNDWTAPLEPTTSSGRSRLFGPALEDSPTSSRRSTSPTPTPQPFLPFAAGGSWGASVTLSDNHGAGD